MQTEQHIIFDLMCAFVATAAVELSIHLCVVALLMFYSAVKVTGVLTFCCLIILWCHLILFLLLVIIIRKSVVHKLHIFIENTYIFLLWTSGLMLCHVSSSVVMLMHYIL